MKSRTLGKDFTVSAVGLGCMGMSHGYGKPRDKKEMTELLAQAVDFGYTFFDTAEVYGTPDNPHANETLLGEALKPFRNRIQIGTKFGIHFDLDSPATNKPIVTDARPEVIRQSVDASLQRLQTDHIDIYYQHRQDPKVPVEEVASVMADLIKEGKILHWGLSEVDADTLRRAHAVCPVTAVQNRYSMMARWYEPMFPVLEELNVGLVAFSPMANSAAAMTVIPTSKRERITAASCPSSRKRIWKRIRNSSTGSRNWLTRRMPRRPRFPWPGCFAKSPGSSPSRVRRTWAASRKMAAPPTLSSRRMKSAASMKRWNKSTCPTFLAVRK